MIYGIFLNYAISGSLGNDLGFMVSDLMAIYGKHSLVESRHLQHLLMQVAAVTG